MNQAVSTPDYVVSDLSLAEWGRKEIRIAESEMPALMALRREYAEQKPLAGARILADEHRGALGSTA